MPVNLGQIEALLAEDRLKYRFDAKAGHLLTGFATESYADATGTRGVAVAVSVSEDGQFLEFTAPWLYDAKRARDPGRLYQALLDVSMQTKLVRFEHDPEDGEVRATVAFPLEDGTLTRRQFRRLLEAIPKAVNRWHPVILKALDEGVVDLKTRLHRRQQEI
jgi:hypothetical protein